MIFSSVTRKGEISSNWYHFTVHLFIANTLSALGHDENTHQSMSQPPSPTFSGSIHTVYYGTYKHFRQILQSQLCSVLTFIPLAKQKILSLSSRNIECLPCNCHQAPQGPPPPTLIKTVTTPMNRHCILYMSHLNLSV